MKELTIKSSITLGAVAILVLHAVRPDFTIDAVSLGLLAVAALPWLSSIIKSAEFPGGWKVEFQDVQRAGELVTKGTSAKIAPPVPGYAAIAEKDPNLALVGLRIEIEKRLRSLAERNGLRSSGPLIQIVRDLQRTGVLNDPSASGLQELIMAGNQAAHGASVEPAAAVWAIEYGPSVLSVLDSKLQD